MQIAIHCAGMGCGLHSPLQVALPGVLFSGGGSRTWNQHGAIAITTISGYGMCAAGSMHCAGTQGGGTAKCADGCLLLTIKLILPPPIQACILMLAVGRGTKTAPSASLWDFLVMVRARLAVHRSHGDFVLSPPPSPSRGAFWYGHRNMDPKWHCHHHHHGIGYDVRCRANAVCRHIWLLCHSPLRWSPSIQECLFLVMAVEHGTKMVPSPSPRKVKEYQVAVCGAQSGSGGTVKHAMLLATHHRIDPLPPPPDSGVRFVGGSGTWNQHGTVTITTSIGADVGACAGGQCACAGSQGGGGRGQHFVTHAWDC